MEDIDTHFDPGFYSSGDGVWHISQGSFKGPYINTLDEPEGSLSSTLKK